MMKNKFVSWMVLATFVWTMVLRAGAQVYATESLLLSGPPDDSYQASAEEWEDFSSNAAEDPLFPVWIQLLAGVLITIVAISGFEPLTTWIATQILVYAIAIYAFFGFEPFKDVPPAVQQPPPEVEM